MAHQHKEAFCLMYYHNKETGLGFLVWNSRDGVTPFIVFEDGKEYMHEHWSFDRIIVPGYSDQHSNYINNQILVPGQRIFRDATEAENREFAIKRLKSFKGTEFEKRLEDSDYEETLQSLIDAIGNSGPIMVKVTEKGKMP